MECSVETTCRVHSVATLNNKVVFYHSCMYQPDGTYLGGLVLLKRFKKLRILAAKYQLPPQNNKFNSAQIHIEQRHIILWASRHTCTHSFWNARSRSSGARQGSYPARIWPANARRSEVTGNHGRTLDASSRSKEQKKERVGPCEYGWSPGCDWASAGWAALRLGALGSPLGVWRGNSSSSRPSWIVSAWFTRGEREEGTEEHQGIDGDPPSARRLNQPPPAGNGRVLQIWGWRN